MRKFRTGCRGKRDRMGLTAVCLALALALSACSGNGGAGGGGGNRAKTVENGGPAGDGAGQDPGGGQGAGGAGENGNGSGQGENGSGTGQLPGGAEEFWGEAGQPSGGAVNGSAGANGNGAGQGVGGTGQGIGGAGQSSGQGGAGENGSGQSSGRTPSPGKIDFLDQVPDEALESLKGMAYYGDPEECHMSARQAKAFADVVQAETDALGALHDQMVSTDPDIMSGLAPAAYAALIDTGNGVPILFFGGGSGKGTPGMNGPWDWQWVTAWSIWQYADGKAEAFRKWQGDGLGAMETEWPELYQDHMTLLRYHSAADMDLEAYLYRNGGIETEARARAMVLSDGQASAGTVDYIVDGAQSSEEDFNRWREQWSGQPLAEVLGGWDRKGSVNGGTLSETAVQVLNEYADLAGGASPLPGN